MKRRDVLKIGAAATTAPVVAQQSTRPAWQPRMLDAHQNATVIALTDLIIPATDTPGAKAAQVHRYIDLLLADGSATQRVSFLQGLSWLDGYCLRTESKPFVSLAPAEQTAVLELLSTGNESDLEPGVRFFHQIKSLTSRIYYATEAGFQELNKGGRVPSSFACKHPEHG